MLAPALLDLAAGRFAGRPYVLGRWQASFAEARFGPDRLARLRRHAEAPVTTLPLVAGPRLELDDVREGLTKGCVFGVACSLIAVYEGYNATPTAEGVGRATTRTVVIGSLMVLWLDFLLTALMFS